MRRTLLPLLMTTLFVASLLSWRTVVHGNVEAPVAVDDGAFVVGAGGRLVHTAPGLLANDTGAGPLTARLTRAPLFGTLDLTPDGSFTYTHGGSGTSPDSFGYTASDGSQESLEATVPIAVIAAHGATLRVPDDHPSIQAAHDAAASGDLILVAPGTYEENLELTKAVTIASWFLATGDAQYVDTTVIDGRERDFVVNVLKGAEPPTLVGLTIQNGDDGITGEAKFHLLRSRVRWTTDGIDYERGSGGTVRYSLFEENTDDGIDPDHDVDTLIEHNVIRNNGGDGIEIRLQPYQGPTLHYVIRHNLIYGNQEDGIQLIDYDVLTDRRFEIAYNAIYDNVQAGIGMMSGANTRENFEGASIEEPILIHSNTFARNDHGLTGGDNTVVLNNVFLGHTRIAVKNVDANSSLAFNLFHDNGTDAENANLDVASTFVGDPLLAADLRPLAASPVIDLGTDHYVFQGQTVLDLDPSHYQGSAPDLGAFEWLPGTGLGPRAPDLLEPADGTPSTPLTPVLRWQGQGGSFRLQVARQADFVSASVVLDVSIPGDRLSHLVAPGLLDHATAYHWRVRGSDGTGTGAWSSASRFTTLPAQGPPPQPNLTEPLHGTGDLPLTPRLAWRGAADLFHVQIARDPGFEHLVLDLVVTDESYVVHEGSLEHAATYHWRVAGENDFGVGPWSPTSSFSTEPPPLPLPPPYDLRAPAQTDDSIDLRWSTFDDPRVVAFRIYRDGDPIAAESEDDHQAVDLLPHTLYRFHVTAIDGFGNESLPSATLEVATLPVPPTVFELSQAIAAEEDDAEERFASGTVVLKSSDLELGQDAGEQLVGLRFRDLPLPPAVTIVGARIQLTSDEPASEATALILEGEASDHTLPFTKALGDLSGRPRTVAAVPWHPQKWDAGEAGRAQRTPELTEVVQEIVDRPGWLPGNAMGFLLSGSGRRTAHAFQGVPERAARLEIEYVEPCWADLDGDGFPCDLDCDDTDAAVHPDAEELCDGIDNDCDQNVDEGDAVDAALWYADRDGDGHGDEAVQLLACSLPPGWTADAGDCNDADATAFPGASESCNARDDDCDGLADEGYVPQVTQCGVGACGAVGSTACVDGVVVDGCQPGSPAPLDAGCDGVDDDCDGVPDDDYVAPETSCGVGACGATGALECVAGVTVDSCQPGAPATSDARCDGIDEDCDGEVDEDYVALACPTGLLGVCGEGSTACQEGATVCLEPTAAASDTLCNGLDDDCDGEVDEEFAPQSCTTGLPGVCATGSSSCEDGTELCLGNELPSTELCQDGVDNDCDGSTDLDDADSCRVGIQSFPVGASADDAEERITSDGMVVLTSSDLELTEDGPRLQVVGIRFDGVVLPPGASVLRAAIQFTADQNRSGATNLLIQGEASDDASPFEAVPSNVTTRPRTSSAVSWEPGPWSNRDAGAGQRTPDLASIVQEIVDRPGWESGQALAFLISGSGDRNAQSHDGAPADAPRLEIEYLETCWVDADGDGFSCALDCDDENADVHPGRPDLCNGVDDDCDGEVDEEFSSQSCVTGLPGQCAVGASRCESGTEVCDALLTPEPELCSDGIDNDCDGSADFPDDDDCG